MSKKLLRIAPLLIVLASSVSAFADEPEIDARLVGYKDARPVVSSSASAAWFILAGLGLVAIGPLFLNAHRTHLD